MSPHRSVGAVADTSLRVRTFADGAARAACPAWDGLDTASQQRLLASGGVEAERDSTHRNATCVGLHRTAPRALAAVLGGQSVTQRGGQVVFGDSDADFAPGDTEMNAYVGEIQLTDPVGTGTRLSAQELIGSLELVDETIREWGVKIDGGPLLNHGPIRPAIERSDSENTLLDISIPFGDPSQVTAGRLP